MLFFLVLLALAATDGALSDDGQRTVRPSKRRPSENDRVTIDLSALRPSLPGLVYYEVGGGEGGGVTPKLVQVDLSALNPRLQPHVIWPQFNEMDLLDERPFEMSGADAIPYLEGPMLGRRTAKMSHWLDNGRPDAYDFVQDQNKLLSLQGSLPVADEVIVPLDWDEKGKAKKRNVFLTNGWGAGGGRGMYTPAKSPAPNFATYYARMRADRKQARRKETETEGRGSRGSRDLPRSEYLRQDKPLEKVKVSGQESWSLPQQYWNVPHLFGNE